MKLLLIKQILAINVFHQGSEQTDRASRATNHNIMLADVIKNLEKSENFSRRDSELTTSTVETFVSERPVFTLKVPEGGDRDRRLSDVERNAQELQQTKGWCFHFYHTHTGTILVLGRRVSVTGGM